MTSMDSGHGALQAIEMSMAHTLYYRLPPRPVNI